MKTKLAHVWLQPDRIMFLHAEAKRRGISVDELVSEAAALFLEEQRRG
jgi:hypothetical protein